MTAITPQYLAMNKPLNFSKRAGRPRQEPSHSTADRRRQIEALHERIESKKDYYDMLLEEK